MNAQSITPAFGIALAATEPFPAMADFNIRPNSSMSFLQGVFGSVGLSPVVSSNNVRIPEPTEGQKLSLKMQGVDASAGKLMFPCSPRTQSRGF